MGSTHRFTLISSRSSMYWYFIGRCQVYRKIAIQDSKCIIGNKVIQDIKDIEILQNEKDNKYTIDWKYI
jgi:hypothetical protein